MRKASIAVGLVFLGGCQGPELTGTHSLGLESVTSFGSNPGSLKMYYSAPANLPQGAPLVTLLHGCGDTAENFAAAWDEWSSLSETHGFALLYPEQQPENNVGGVSCFNWFESTNQTRNEGENLSIRQMVEDLRTRIGSDPARTYAVGFSAGAAEVVNLLATQPDVFSGGVSVAGVPFECATSLFDAFTCLGGSVDREPQEWAQRVIDAAPSFSGGRPRLQIWQGLTDGEVNADNRVELLEQWTALHGIDATPDATESALGGTRSEYRDTSGNLRIEAYEFPSVGHELRQGWAPRMAAFLGLTTSPQADAGAPVEIDAGNSASSDAGSGLPDAGTPDASPTDADDPAPDGETQREEGCSCREGRHQTNGGWWALTLGGMLGWVRRRRKHVT